MSINIINTGFVLEIFGYTELAIYPFSTVFPHCRLDDLISEDSGLKLKEKLLEQEKDLLKTQNDWLTQELESKSEQLIQLRKERASTVGELESQSSTREEEVWV